MHKFRSLVILVLIFSSCDDDAPSAVDTFNKNLAKVQCENLFYCCEGNGGLVNTDYLTIEQCVSGQIAANRNLYNEARYSIKEENLPLLLAAYEAILKNGCNYQITPEERLSVDDLYFETFWGFKNAGEECSGDEECGEGLSCALNDHYTMVCTPFAQVGEECMFADCARGLDCIGMQCYAPMLQGDACVNDRCAGAEVFCNTDTQVCETLRLAGEACTLNRHCYSNKCSVDDICEDLSTITEDYCAESN